MSVLPSLATYFMVQETFITQNKIYKSRNLSRMFDDTEILLKKASQLDPQNEPTYRQQFSEIQNLKLIYGDDTFFSEKLGQTILKFFAIGMGVVVGIALLFGFSLSVVINQIYLKSFLSLEKEKEKSRFLNEMAKWQEIAKLMTHEIRRPLQPIRIWMSNLNSTTVTSTMSEEGLQQLSEATIAIESEIKSLSSLVEEFSQFTSLPKPEIEVLDLQDFIKSFIRQYGSIWPTIQFKYSDLPPDSESNATVAIDSKIFRNILTNLVENAFEANNDHPIVVDFQISHLDQLIVLDIFNSGKTLTQNQQERIFDLHFTTKSNLKNQGLGLSFVKSMILEHNGDIVCCDESNGVRFKVYLPLEKHSKE